MGIGSREEGLRRTICLFPAIRLPQLPNTNGLILGFGMDIVIYVSPAQGFTRPDLPLGGLVKGKER